MVRLDAVNLSAKLGQRVNMATLERIELPGKQITELGNFANFACLDVVLLPNNRIESKDECGFAEMCYALICAQTKRDEKH
jgi:hypothetical protein